MTATEFGIERVPVRSFENWNSPTPIEVNEKPRTSEVVFELQKALGPIDNIEGLIISEEVMGVEKNALYPIEVTEAPSISEVNYVPISIIIFRYES